MPANPIDVRDAPERSRFEGTLDGDVVAVLDYRRDERTGTLLLTHAEVSPEHGGRGIGSALVKASLDDLADRGERIVPLCSFVAAFVRDNPGYRRLVA